MIRSLKTMGISILLFALCLLLLPASGIADAAGVLSEGEVNNWLSQALMKSAAETPLNAPVGEDALTEDGYAFIYSFATFYYDKPVLDQDSVLKAVSLTDDSFADPRGVTVGASAELLLSSYGWKNPMLLGDGTFAAFYQLNSLPEAAYWSWAQQEDGKLLSVRCAIHVKAAEGRYTDAGILYTVDHNTVAAIRLYGLDQTLTEQEVLSNLAAVTAVEAAITGDEVPPAVEGYSQKNEAKPFQTEDLCFSDMDYLNLNERSATLIFGKALSEETVKDDTGAWLITTQREGLTLSYTVSPDRSSWVLDSLSVHGNLIGPRGICLGMTLEDVLSRFYADGKGTVLHSQSVLYGDGNAAPTGVLEREEGAGTTVRYRTQAQSADGSITVTLRMTFENNLLKEWMIYSW